MYLFTVFIVLFLQCTKLRSVQLHNKLLIETLNLGAHKTATVQRLGA